MNSINKDLCESCGNIQFRRWVVSEDEVYLDRMMQAFNVIYIEVHEQMNPIR